MPMKQTPRVRMETALAVTIPKVVRRFWAKVDTSGDCWQWIAQINTEGYGIFTIKGHVRAHRFAYELLVGPIPMELEIDHLCRNRACVNPKHLEAVTHSVNTMRGDSNSRIRWERMQTHCLRGHAFDLFNTYYHRRTGSRQCRICGVARHRRWRSNSRLLALAGSLAPYTVERDVSRGGI